METFLKIPLEDRKAMSREIREKHDDKLPLICEGEDDDDDLVLDKKPRYKFLVPNTFTFGAFQTVLRKQRSCPPHTAMYMFCNGKMYGNSERIADVFEKEKSEDGFLYVLWAKENTFGCKTVTTTHDAA